MWTSFPSGELFVGGGIGGRIEEPEQDCSG